LKERKDLQFADVLLLGGTSPATPAASAIAGKVLIQPEIAIEAANRTVVERQGI
jgi:hypothetical protein